MILIEIVALALAAATLVPACILFIQVVAALAPARGARAGARPRVGVVMPAHDEESVIAATLRAALPQLAPGDRLVVVADNCSDSTAAVAAREGATVVERRDQERRGKNYALEFGVRELERDPPDVVIILDADCHAHDGALESLARACSAAGRPVQSLYLMLPPEDPGVASQVAAFAWTVKNWVRPLGMRRLGLPCQLMGTGTAFPWHAIRGFPIANAEMAEDYKFGIDMALAGHAAVFSPDGTFTSRFPATEATALVQRTRWEHGHLQLILREVPRLLLRGLLARDLRLVGLALDMLVPPLSFLALAALAAFGLGAALSLAGGREAALALSSVALGLVGAAVLVAWLGWGRESLPARAVFALPGYLWSKIPIYLRFLTRRQKVWIKTRRD